MIQCGCWGTRRTRPRGPPHTARSSPRSLASPRVRPGSRTQTRPVTAEVDPTFSAALWLTSIMSMISTWSRLSRPRSLMKWDSSVNFALSILSNRLSTNNTLQRTHNIWPVSWLSASYSPFLYELEGVGRGPAVLPDPALQAGRTGQLQAGLVAQQGGGPAHKRHRNSTCQASAVDR